MFGSFSAKVVWTRQTFTFGLAMVAAVLGAVMVPLATATKPAEAAFPGVNGKIAFQSERDGNWEVYVMDPDGTNPMRLTDNPAWEGDPAVSPDGKKIAFVTTRHGGLDEEEIYVMAAADENGDENGDDPTRLTNDETPDHAPAFSPNGEKIAYQEYGDGDSEVFLMDSDGTGQATRLTSNALFDGNPVFSPDGEKVYFVTDRDGDPRNHAELYVMDAADNDGDGNGDNQARLAGDPAIDYFASAISPDATRLAYQDYRDGDSEIYVKNLNGTGTPVRLTTNAAWDGLPAFSPDGTKLVFGTDRDLGLDKEEIYATDVADIDGDGNGDHQVRLTDDATPDYEPDWGPDTPPAVTKVRPAAGAIDVPARTEVTATYSEAMDESTVNGATFTLREKGIARPVNAAVSYDPKTLTAALDPARKLAAGASYVAKVTTGTTDEAGNPLATKKTWRFTVR